MPVGEMRPQVNSGNNRDDTDSRQARCPAHIARLSRNSRMIVNVLALLERRRGIDLILSGRLRPNKDEIPDDGRFVAKPKGRHAVRDTLRDKAVGAP
jgi:hypothetical protein